MIISKEQANNVLTEIKCVLTKDIESKKYVIILKNDGLHLTTLTNKNVVLDSKETSSLINQVLVAKKARKLTEYTRDFHKIISGYLHAKTLPYAFDVTSVCELIVKKANRIDELLNIMYGFDYTRLNVESVEHENIIKRILKDAPAYSFDDFSKILYQDNYRELSELILSKYDKYATLGKIEKQLSKDYTISNLLRENKLSNPFLEEILTDLAKRNGVEALEEAKKLYKNTDKLYSIIHNLHSSMDGVNRLSIKYEKQRKELATKIY